MCWVAALILAAATADVVRGGPVSSGERDKLWSRTELVVPWAALTKLGGRPTLALMTTAAAAAALTRRRSALVPPATVAVGYVARWGLMHVVNRDRPPMERWLVTADGASYPSRHATSAMLGALVLRRELPHSTALDAALGIGVTAVAVSRIRLGVHWPTDVLAGVALATLVDSALTLHLQV